MKLFCVQIAQTRLPWQSRNDGCKHSRISGICPHGEHVCVCMYVSMCVCMCVCMYICMETTVASIVGSQGSVLMVSMHACMYVCVCMYVCICVCMYGNDGCKHSRISGICPCKYVWKYVCMYVCMETTVASIVGSQRSVLMVSMYVCMYVCICVWKRWLQA